MIKTYLALFGVCMGLSVAPSARGQTNNTLYRLTPEPVWVTKAGFGSRPASSTNGSAGVVYLVLDRQIDVASESVYQRVVKRVTSPTGLQQESQLTFNFEPSHQTIEFHQINIRREGKLINRLLPEKLKVVDEERDSDRQIYNGEKAVVAILADVRVGDEIESAHTLRGFNPIFGGRYVDAAWVEWAVPVQDSQLRILWPKGRRELHYKLHGRQDRPTIADLGEVREYLWRFRDLAPVDLEDRLPLWHNPYAWLQLSEFESWGEVQEWARALTPAGAAASDELGKQVGLFRLGQQTDEARALAALQFVQQEVRYLGLEIGPNSHKPYEPSLVLERRFGDCKDKSGLLCALLSGLGIPCETVLVNTLRSSRMEELIPSPLAFNHMIARVQIGNEVFWLDPTLTHQGGSLRDRSIDKYAQVLPLEGMAQGLVSIPMRADPKPTKTVRETITVHSYERPAELEVFTIHEGRHANEMRASLAGWSPEEMEKWNLNYYAKLYSGVRSVGHNQISDDKPANRLIVSEKYTMDRPWTSNAGSIGRRIPLSANSISEEAAKPESYARKMPLGLRFPVHVRHEISINLPQAGNFPSEDREIKDSAQRFRFVAKQSGTNLSLTFDYEALTNCVPAERTREFLENLENIHDACAYSISLPPLEAEDFAGRVNWPVLMWGLLTATLATVAAVRVYDGLWFPRTWKNVQVIDGSLKPKGLGGWLILVGFGLATGFIGFSTTLVKELETLAPQSWAYLTNPKGAAYHPLWSVTLLGSLTGNIVAFVMNLLLLVLFFKKRAEFPRAYIIYMVFVAALHCAYFFVAPNARDDSGKPGTATRQVTRAVSGAVVWSAYMLKSKRVKHTFVNQAPGTA